MTGDEEDGQVTAGGKVMMDTRHLLWGGVVSPLLFLAADVLGGLMTTGYVFRENAVSELMLVGSEHRTMVSALMLVSSLAGLVFAVGICLHFPYSRNRLVLVAGVLLALSALITSMTSTVLPQDPRDGDVTLAGTMHLALVGMNVLVSIVAMLLAGIGLRRELGWTAFMHYSVATLLIMAAGGVVSTILIKEDIQLLGVTERVSIYAYLLWNAVLALLLLERYEGFPWVSAGKGMGP